jgi:ribonuclease HIII
VVDKTMESNELEKLKAITSYTCKLDSDQILKLQMYLKQHEFEFRDVNYAHFGASAKNLSMTMFKSGKLLIQGKRTTEFIQYFLEPEILKEVRLGYEHLLDEEGVESARIGVDESGKGDYFGPLVISGVYADEENIKLLYDLKVKDSKLTSDARSVKLMNIICSKFKHSVVIIGPEKYNVLYNRMENLNKMLAWGHARVIENLLSSVNCKKVVVDKFGDSSLVKNALMRKGRRIELEQKHRAESDIVVAAASIIARGKFVTRMEKQAEEFGMEFPKGGGAKVNQAGSDFIDKHGLQQLGKVAKLHFKNTQKIIGVEAGA